MPTYHHEIVQHSPEWYAIKAGKWSASSAAIIMGGLDTKGLSDLVQTIAFERMYGPTEEPRFQSAAMQRGNEMEAEAREWVAFNTDSQIGECGFVEHASIPNVGWSPDGLILPKRKRATEIKCLLHKAWMEVLRTGKVPAEYRWQCRWAYWVGELDSLDFTVYHPKPGGLSIAVESPTPEECAQMAERVGVLETKVEQWLAILQRAA